MKKYILAATMLLLILTGCGNSEDNNATEYSDFSQAESETQVEMPDTLGAGRSFKAENLNIMGVSENPIETATIDDIASGTFIIYDNRTVSYMESDGTSQKGVYISGLNQYGSPVQDTILLIDTDTNSTRYLVNLRYLDEYGQDVDLDQAVTIRFQESQMTGEFLGQLAVAGAVAETPDIVYLLFMDPEYLPEGHSGGIAYGYSISTGDYTEYNWMGDRDCSDISRDMKIAINDTNNTTVYYGTFNAVYAIADGIAASTSTGEMNTGEAVAEVTAQYCYSYESNAGTYDSGRVDFDVIADATDKFIIYSNNLIIWTDQNGDTWRGFYFQGLNENGYDYMQFQNGKELEIDELRTKAWEGNRHICIMLYSVMREVDSTSGDFCPSFVGTAKSVAPDKVFIMYGDTNYGNVTVYDCSNQLYYDGSWWTDYASSENVDTSNPQNITVHLSGDDTEYTIDSFDEIEAF